jgi:hypothetical protein
VAKIIKGKNGEYLVDKKNRFAGRPATKALKAAPRSNVLASQNNVVDMFPRKPVVPEVNERCSADDYEMCSSFADAPASPPPTVNPSPHYASTKETAQHLRRGLKDSFPGVKFSVRSSVYSGGSSIDVSWVDGPSASEVEKVSEGYAGATFDGMTDMKSYKDATDTIEVDGEKRAVRWGADYVFAHRELSDEVMGVGRERASKVLKVDNLSDTTFYDSVAVDGLRGPDATGYEVSRYFAGLEAEKRYNEKRR